MMAVAVVGIGQVVAWEATHSAAQVSCLASYFLDSDRALEWRALDLLRQAADDTAKQLPPPAEVASRYEQCLVKADVGGSAVYCETDMLRHLEPSVVRHALLISRAAAWGCTGQTVSAWCCSLRSSSKDALLQRTT